jgi:hypothetical protein
MTVCYEWDVETHTATETEEHEAGEVLDHDHRDSYAQCLHVASQPAPEGCRFAIVLVRDDDSGRSWAYLEEGKLPSHFINAYGIDVAKVPLQYHREVERAKKEPA